MEFIHDRKSNILFSLYGSKVNRIKIHNKTLTLTVEEMYQLLDGVNVNIRMYNFDDVQCTVIPSVAYGFVTGMNLQLC